MLEALISKFAQIEDPDPMRQAAAGLANVAAAKPSREQPRCREMRGFRFR